MKHVGPAVLVVIVLACGIASAQVAWTGPGMWGMGGGRWSNLMTALPGAYGLVNRLDLNAEQVKVMDELASDWMKKYQGAYKAANAKAPQLSAADAKDAAKLAEQRKKWREAYDEAMGQPPVEKIANLLAPEQLGKILEANKLLSDWAKWLAEYMAKFDKKLDDAVGPAPADPALRQLTMTVYILESFQKGAAALASRLGLTKEQEAALQELSTKSWAEYAATFGLSGPMLRGDGGTWTQDSFRLQSVLTAAGGTERTERNREAVGKILTDDQKGRVAKAVPLLAERDKDVWTSYQEFTGKVDKILPPPKGKADAGGAAGGVPYKLPYGVR